MKSGGGSTRSIVEGLGTVQRILVTTDGTITHILEACVGESIHVVKLSHSLRLSPEERLGFELDDGEQGLRRKVLLRGRTTGNTFMYAESVILLDRLPRVVVDGLFNTDAPIGSLLAMSRVETVRDILVCQEERDQHVAAHLGIPADDTIVSRTYRILSGGRPLAFITEKFAKQNFLLEKPLSAAVGQVDDANGPAGGAD